MNPTAEPGPSTQPATHAEYHRFYILLTVLTAALGGLMFGYDWVVIGGAELFYERYFHLTDPIQIGWVMSSALVGALFGAMFAGNLSDRFGRKPLLLLSGFLFVITSLGTGLASSFTVFVLFRVLGGVAIGVASNLSALYIAEIAPAEMRGRLVAVNQLTIAFGVVLAQIVNLLVAKPVAAGTAINQIPLESWNVQAAWRWMFGLTAIPALIFFVSMFFVPESPRWLAKRGRDSDAFRILERVGGTLYARQTEGEIAATLSPEMKELGLREVLKPRMFGIVVLGILLAVLQQWCGINIIYQYGSRVFADAGYPVSGILFNIVITGIVSVVMTIAAITTVDRWGRRSLMLAGTLGLAVIYAVTGWTYHQNIHGLLPVVLVVSAIACYSYSLAPVTWVLLSEIFPNRIRGSAMSISVVALWIGNFLLSQTFPAMYQRFGLAKCFWVYGTICLAGFVFVLIRLPETKGKSLEELERMLVD